MAESDRPTVSPWWATGVVYQIYVRSFADANGDGIGDLGGIRSRLGYLAELGVDGVWLNPCYPSPQHDHGYDVADYTSIEPDYGDLAMFDALVAEAHALDIRVLMDIVPNHCSNEHAWFRASVAAGPGSMERARFWFRDGKGAGGSEAPNNWLSYFGGPAWTRIVEPDGRPGQWYLHMFAPEQPDWNWEHADVIEHFHHALRFWFDRGVDGFRVDAPVPVGKEPQLPDNDPPGADALAAGAVENPHVMFRPEGHVVWRHWRRVVDEYERANPGRDLVMIAETYAPKRPDLLAEYIRPDEFQQVFGFDLLLASWNAPAMKRAIDDTIDALTAAGVPPAWTLNNHDNQRTVTRYGRADAALDGSWAANNVVATQAPIDLELGERRARAALLLMLGLPGCAYLYQGEELGLPEVVDLPDAAREDPVFVRSNGERLTRDGCRVPLPWADDLSTSFGFSPSVVGRSSDPPAPPWLPQPADWGRYALDRQTGRAGSMHAHYVAALAARRQLAGRRGRDLVWLDTGSSECLAFCVGDHVVVVNFGATAVTLPATLHDGRTVVLASVAHAFDATVVPPDAAVWLI